MTRVAGGTPAVAGLFWNSWHDPGDRIRNRPLCIPALYLLSLSCRGYLPREPLPFSFEKDGSLALRPSSVKVNIFLWLFVQRIVSIYMHLFLLYRLSSQEWESFTLRFIQRYESAWSGTPFPPFLWTKAADSRLWWTEYIVFFYLSTRASTSCPPSTSCHCDCSLEWTLECRIRECLINDHENGKIVIGLGNENNNSARASRFLYTSLPSLLKLLIMCCCYLFDFLTLMFDIFIDVWVKLFSALFYTSQRMRTEYNCSVVAGKPKVAFRETIGKEARYELNVSTSTSFNITDSFHSIGAKKLGVNWRLCDHLLATLLMY